MVRASFKFICLVLWTLLMMCVTVVPWALRLEWIRKRVVRFTFRMANKLLGVRLHARGEVSAHRPLLVVSNHSSYIDIFVLGASSTVSFTPKSDIKYWPIVGWCCTLANCVFVERKASKMANTSQQIHKKMQAGQAICLFAEGTTGNGTELKPFKSGFFSLAEGEEGLQVQPITIVYTHRNGEVLSPETRQEIAWFGEDTALLPHLLRFLSFKHIDAELVFHEPVTMSAFDNRKALCAYAELEVKKGLDQVLGELT